MKWTVSPQFNGLTLKAFLKAKLPDLPTTALYRFLRCKEIIIEDKPARDLKTKLKTGNEIRLKKYYTNPSPPPVKAAIELSLLFEDAMLLVLAKPRGLSTQPGEKSGRITVIDLLKAQAQNYTPFLVHRLDRYTSGCLLVAKEKSIAAELSKLFKQGKIQKKYLALVYGRVKPQAGKITKTLDAKKASTYYQVLETRNWGNKELSLVEIKPETGRLHQIRRHLAALGFPLIGDDRYGNWKINKEFQKSFKIKGFILHSVSISFKHPLTAEPLFFKASPPQELLWFFPELYAIK